MTKGRVLPAVLFGLIGIFETIDYVESSNVEKVSFREVIFCFSFLFFSVSVNDKTKANNHGVVISIHCA